MRVIIAPTDFSPVSINAVNYAADLATEINAELVLLNIVELPVTAPEMVLTESDYDELTEEPKQELAVLTNQLLLRTKNKIKIHSTIQFGTLEHELEEICELRNPFAVVMGSKDARAANDFPANS